MKQEFVPYELAIKLKPLGFDEPCFGFYLAGVIKVKEYKNSQNKNTAFYNNTVCSAPTFSQAFRWFREKYNMSCKIEASQEDLKVNAYHYFYQIQTDSHIVGFGIQHNLTYEEAEIVCLQKLIEIVETQSK